jgi:hypothetical protein
MWRWEGNNSQRGYCGLAGSPIGLLAMQAADDEPAEAARR